MREKKQKEQKRREEGKADSAWSFQFRFPLATFQFRGLVAPASARLARLLLGTFSVPWFGCPLPLIGSFGAVSVVPFSSVIWFLKPLQEARSALETIGGKDDPPLKAIMERGKPPFKNHCTKRRSTL